MIAEREIFLKVEKKTFKVKDKKTGEVIELHCIYDPATKGGDAPDGRKVKRFKEDIKGVTYHELEIKQQKDGTWETTILFDI